jgi:uncharacterized protein
VTVSRRSVVKLGLGGGALSLLSPAPLVAAQPSATPVLPADRLRAKPLPLTAVRVTGGPLKQAQDVTMRYLLQLEPDRMMAFYRDRAGLPRKAEPYGGWDGPGRNLTGHIAGHYLSAVSLMYAATGDARFKERADYLVREMKEVQDAHGDGYLVALEKGRECFARLSRGEIRSASFDLNGEWAPWYTLHKTYAGLRDAYRHTGNRTALDVETRFAQWAEGVLKPLDDNQLQHMMNTEFGGMNEVLVDLAADTGDDRWLELAWKFEHRDFIEPLQRHRDNLGGKHGNTAVPKIIGSASRFINTGLPADLVGATFFWDRVVQHHSFATGGHGKDEYWGPPGLLNDRVDGRTAETCNIYNMLKLTRQLFALRPDAHYADFHERALFNHILGSIDPEDGRTCYMVPVGRGVQREYGNMFQSFTCCVGSGMESHALHADGIYYEAGDRLWVNLYAPSTAQWADAGVALTMETGFPEGETATLTVQARSPRRFVLALRRPWWAGDGFAVKVNGTAITLPDPAPPAGVEIVGRSQYDRTGDPHASSYVEIDRTWRAGDRVEVTLPKSLHLEPVPDNARRAALMWGPLVLAGDLGPEPVRATGRGQRLQPPVVPVLVAADQPVTEWLRPVAGMPGRFRTAGVGRLANVTNQVQDVEFQPFYSLHRRVYGGYWDLFTEAEWQEQQVVYAAEAERVRRLEAATVAQFEPGDDDSERPYGYQGGEGIVPNLMLGRVGRRGPSWFSYEVPVQPQHAMGLIVTYYSDDRRGTPADFEILVDDTVVSRATIERSEPPRFHDVAYPIAPALVTGKERVTVRFRARPDSQIATVFGIRMVRMDELR